MLYLDHTDSPLGPITMASDGVNLTGLWFDGQKYFPEFPESVQKKSRLPVFEDTRRWLHLYFSGTAPTFLPDLAPAGTPFQQDIWEILCSIPYGETRTYGQIAELYAQKHGILRMSAQAVGGAVGHNPISILIPCHRVVGADGSLTGYAGGLFRKTFLLELESGC